MPRWALGAIGMVRVGILLGRQAKEAPANRETGPGGSCEAEMHSALKHQYPRQRPQWPQEASISSIFALKQEGVKRHDEKEK